MSDAFRSVVASRTGGIAFALLLLLTSRSNTAARQAAPEPYVIGLTPFYQSGGWLNLRGDAPAFGHVAWLQLPWPTYNAAGGGTHPAMGDVDGDGVDEIVVGMTSADASWLAILDDAGHGHAARWVHLPWPAPSIARYPAVGDVDDDGRDEIVVGFEGHTQGWFLILDDATTNFAVLAWRQVDWPWYQSAEAEGNTHPAVGDVDGDGVAEIVIGLGNRSGGWVEIVNGAPQGFTHRAWTQAPWTFYNTDNGETWPAAGDVDGDGVDEIVLGLGARSAGWLAVLDDAAHGYGLLRWLQLGWTEYNDANGQAHPAVGNIDADAADEIVAGLARWPGHGGWFEIFDDLAATQGSAGLTWRQVGWAAFNADGGGTYPAIARRRRP